MTVPILPGPFSFLAGAGQALGAYGGARAAEEHYQNQLALEQQQQALARVALLQRIVNPLAFAQGGSQAAAMEAARLPVPTTGEIYIPKEITVGQRFAQEVEKAPVGSPQSQISVGAATAGQAAKDLEAQRRSQIAVQGLAGLSDEQARAFEGVLPEEIIKLGNEARKQQLITNIAQQEPARVEAKMQQDIAESVRRRLPKDPEFNKVADYAKVGAIGYLQEQLNAWARVNEGSKAVDTQRLRTVLETTKQAGSAYRAAHAQWIKGLQDAVNAVTSLGGPGVDKDPEEQLKLKNAAAQEYVSRFGQEPKADEYLNAAIEANGLDTESYQQAYRELIHVTGATAPGDNFQAVLTRHRRNPYSAAEIDKAVKDGDITPEQGAQLKAMIPKSK